MVCILYQRWAAYLRGHVYDVTCIYLKNSMHGGQATYFNEYKAATMF